ncbi:MAG: hypothetical protein OXT09_25640 [Myxococcales bacterium]|nr:hypothetical protein [Myxococcales bacterium]
MSDEALLIRGRLIQRRVVGAFGLLFPFVLVAASFLAGARELLPSLSAYYGDAGARDLYVGIQFTTAWFFFSYQGHDRRDRVAGKLAWASTLLVALVPSTTDNQLASDIHFWAATAEFLVLAYFSLFLFTETGPDGPSPQKLIRNRIYRICGWIMIAILTLAMLYYVLLAGKGTWVDDYRPIFVLETGALLAFGFSWIVKGETLWKDQEPVPVPVPA